MLAPGISRIYRTRVYQNDPTVSRDLEVVET